MIFAAGLFSRLYLSPSLKKDLAEAAGRERELYSELYYFP